MKTLPFARKSLGAALLVCLMLLTALTLLGLAALSDAGLQQRMTANIEHTREAFRGANFSLDWAESWLLSRDGTQRPLPCSADCSPGSVIRADGTYPGNPGHESAQWWEDHAFRAGVDPASGATLDNSPALAGGYWIIEEVYFESAPDADGAQPNAAYYRLIARHANAVGNVVAVTESILARPWGDAAWSDPLPRDRGQPGFCRQNSMTAPCGRLAWRQLR